MQAAARDHWRGLFKKKPEYDEDNPAPDMESEDFGFWLADWDTALEMGWIFDQKRILPRAGGWLDQTVQDRADIMRYLRGKMWAQQEAGNDDDFDPPTRRNDGSIPMPNVNMNIADF